jgi:cytochrome c peroxidase
MPLLRKTIFLFTCLLSLVGCDSEPLQIKEKLPLQVFTALPTTVNAPANNPVTSEKIALGRLLFFDPILSGDKDVSCATCHHPDQGYAEFRDISIGVNGRGLGSKRTFKSPNSIPFVKRNAHTILNTAFNGMDPYGRYQPETGEMFWDSRVEGLEKQAVEPILALEEMRGLHYEEDQILPEVVQRLRSIPEYQDLFEKAFGPGDITSEKLGMAIATFERSLVTTNSRFDQFMRGDREAISSAEMEGFELFKKVGCGNCHNGPMFSDYQQHVLGVPESKKLTTPDSGPAEDFAFRTPSLRNLRFTAPYMHNGNFTSLKRVLEFYEDISGGREDNPNVSKDQYDPLVRKLNIRVRDMAAIVSFLNTLNDEDFSREIPASVPSGLKVGGEIE